jgi:hypothetical protein
MTPDSPAPIDDKGEGVWATSVSISRRFSSGVDWLAITYQFGTVPPVVSVVYRFALRPDPDRLGVARKLRLRFTAGEYAGCAAGVLLD